MSIKLKVFAISGSLRRASYNSAALRAAQALAPADMEIDIFTGLRDIPPYDDDVRAAGFPPQVAEMRRRIAEAHALLIATPEYNHSVPGVLKNAIDWASRQPDAPLNGKSIAILGASMGMMGTVRAQYHLRDMCVFFDAHVVNKPEVFIGQAHTKFDAAGTLTDEPTSAILRTLLESLQAQTLRIQSQLRAAA